MKTEFGIIGLGVMGKSLARNFARNDFKLSLYNRHVEGLEENIAIKLIEDFPELNNSRGFDNLEAFVNSLEVPRKILVMVNAGSAIDSVIEELSVYLDTNDIVIDGGNSHFKQTDRRHTALAKQNIQYFGMGVSGGEEGALLGPSLMPGGELKAYGLIEPYLNKIAAKDRSGIPCCQFIGKDGAGHFVKMVHNGIEYGEMQLIAEIYSVLRFNNNLDPEKISDIFMNWNETSLGSYLLASTSKILRHKEGDDYLIDLILDKASHKGTGSWTAIAAAELGVPFTIASSALNARYISSLKEMRSNLSGTIAKKESSLKPIDLDQLKDAYQLARIVNHHQGFQLINEASNNYNWNIDLQKVAMVWTSGCIIASNLMEELVNIVGNEHTILEHDHVRGMIGSHYENLKSVVIRSLEMNAPIPCLSKSLNYIISLTLENGTGNIIQAQRDYFGSHTYQRIDDPQGISHHTNWKKQ